MTKAVVAANQTAFSKIPGYTSISPFTISSEKFSKNSTTQFSTPDHFLRTYISTRPEHCNKSSAANIKSEDSRMVFTATISSDYWSPQDDGIEIALPHQTDKCISRAEVDADIHIVLYGPATKKRLPVFSEFCPGWIAGTNALFSWHIYTSMKIMIIPQIVREPYFYLLWFGSNLYSDLIMAS